MKINISRENLISASVRALGFIGRNPSEKVLSYALFKAIDDTLTIKATDMERQIEEHVEVEILENGSAMLPVVQLCDIAKKLPPKSELVIQCLEGKAYISTGRYQTVLNIFPADNLPEFNNFEAGCKIKIPAMNLRSILSRVSFAMSRDDVRYYLCGVYVHTDGEKLKFVATDGHRLALARIVGAEVEGDLNKGIIIPRSTVADMVRLLDGDMTVTVRASESRITFHLGSAVITSKLVEGSFPDYQRVIPRHDHRVMRVPASVMSHTVERVAAVSSEKSRPVKFTLGVDDVILSCTDPHGNTAEDVVSASVTGEPLDIGFQARYVQEVMAQISGESIWKFGDSGSPAVLTDGSNSDFMAVLMPIRC